MLAVKDFSFNYKYFKNNLKNNILICGARGVGKTSFVRSALTKLGYTIQNINISGLKEDSYKKFLVNMYQKKSIGSLLMNKKEKKVYVLDDVYKLKGKVQEKIILEMLKRKIPVVLITNNKTNKVLDKALKLCKIMNLTLSEQNIGDIIMKWSKTSELKLSKNALFKIMKFAKFDVRRLMNLLDDLSYEKKITSVVLEKHMKTTIELDMDITMYKSVWIMMNQYIGCRGILELYENDKMVIPLTIHENYMKYCKIDDMTKIMTSMSLGDLVENSMYSDQTYNLSELYGYCMCIYPSYVMNNKYNIDINELNYPKDLNRSTTKMRNKSGNLSVVCSEFGGNMYDYMEIGNMIVDLLDKNKIDVCKEMLTGYSDNSIKSLLKSLKLMKIDVKVVLSKLGIK